MGKTLSKVKKGTKPSATAPSSNWKALQKTLPEASRSSQKFISNKKRKRATMLEARTGQGFSSQGNLATSTKLAQSLLNVLDPEAVGSSSSEASKAGTYVAMDCEMVGVGGRFNERSSLARVSIVNYHGHVLLDTFVRQKERVTDYRTWVSGVRAQDLTNAPTFETVAAQVADILKDRILIGHAVHHDLEVLLLSHPSRSIRDTSSCKALQELAKTKRPGLRTLAKLVLNIDIQAAEHSSVEDARATMAVFRAYKDQFESQLNVPPTLIKLISRRAGIDPSRRYRYSRSLGLASVASDTGMVKTMPEDEADEESATDPITAAATQDLFDNSPAPSKNPTPASDINSIDISQKPRKRSRPPPSQAGWWK